MFRGFVAVLSWLLDGLTWFDSCGVTFAIASLPKVLFKNLEQTSRQRRLAGRINHWKYISCLIKHSKTPHFFHVKIGLKREKKHLSSKSHLLSCAVFCSFAIKSPGCSCTRSLSPKSSLVSSSFPVPAYPSPLQALPKSQKRQPAVQFTTFQLTQKRGPPTLAYGSWRKPSNGRTCLLFAAHTCAFGTEAKQARSVKISCSSGLLPSK